MPDFEPFRALASRTVIIPDADIDTDQIVPARFLTTTSRRGLGRLAFHDWRYFADGSERTDFVLNRIDPTEHRVLVAGRNFGCGSSREHAPWALVDYGFRAVVSTSIADIFTSNALGNGLLPVEVDEATHARLTGAPGAEVTIDLERNELRLADGHVSPLDVEPFARQCLLEGVDTLGWLAGRLPQITEYETRFAS